MKCPLFDFPSYRYEVDDWESKKKELLKQIDKQEKQNKFYGEI